jgi:epoxyqueuosine reductase
MSDSAGLSKLAKSAAARAGFDLCGIASLADELTELRRFPEWIDAGYAGEMDYLKARDESGALKRAAPQSAAPWASSAIVCAINYDTNRPYSTECGDKTRGWIARYAWSQQDYHDVVLRKLRLVEAELRASAPDLTTRCYVDTGPHVERVYAKYASIGWIGKNTCIINQQLGSWLFLGVILCSAELEADLPAADRCGTCTRCIDACPTNAILDAGTLDATRCISYLTIEKRGAIPENLRSAMGNHVFGCDICQDVCPWNQPAEAAYTREPAFQPRAGLVNPALDWLAEMSCEDFQQTFRRSPVKRAKYSGLRRNVAIAMGNSGEQRFRPQLEKLAGDEDEVVAEHARWALARIAHGPAAGD